MSVVELMTYLIFGNFFLLNITISSSLKQVFFARTSNEKLQLSIFMYTRKLILDQINCKSFRITCFYNFNSFSK